MIAVRVLEVKSGVPGCKWGSPDGRINFSWVSKN